MNLTDELLSPTLFWLGHLLFWPMLWRAVRSAQWWRLRDSENLHVWLGSVVAVMLLWSMDAGLADGLQMHLIGATVLTLMFGWAFAALAMVLVVVGTTLHAGEGWAALPINALVLGILPVLVSHGLFRLVDRRLPNHFFIYIFVCAFFGAGLAMGSVGLASLGVHQLAHVYSAEYVNYNYFRYLPLLIFPEAFVSGMLMTVFVLYRPQWVATFDDARYLRNH